MGQQVSNGNLQAVYLTKPDRIPLDSVTIAFWASQEDVHLFLSFKNLPDTTNSERPLIKQIQNQLSILTNVFESEIANTQISNVLQSLINDYKQVTDEIKTILEKQEQLKISLTNKSDDKNQSEIDNNDRQNAESNAQHPSFASKLSALFKSAERNVSTVFHHLFEPKTVDVHESTLSNDQIIKTRIEKMLLNISRNTALLKDCLPVLNHLIFETVNIYDAKNVFIELNHRFKDLHTEWQNESGCHSNLASTEDNPNDFKQTTDGVTLTYLTSIGAFPNKALKKFSKHQYTGQFLSLFLLAHIDFDNTINTNKQFKSGSIKSSMSFEFHSDTFKQLFHIIEQLTIMSREDLNENLVHILIICLRLFTTHFKFLSVMTNNLQRDLLSTNDTIKETVGVTSSSSNNKIEFPTNDELLTWLDTLLILACRVHDNFEQTAICREASKAFIYVLDKKATSFIEKLSFIHKYILENKYLVLVEQLLVELNTSAVLISWIEVLCYSDDKKSEKATAFTILYSLIDIYINPSNGRKTQQIEQILKTFQRLVFIQLMLKLGSSVAFLTTKYLDYILKNSNGKLTLINDILLGLCLMTEKQFDFIKIQSIFTAVLPLLTEFVLQNSMRDNNLHYNCWVLGKMSHFLIAGPPQDTLELNYINKLQSPLFAGGCENTIKENNPYLFDLFQSNIAIYTQFNLNNYNQSEVLSDQEFLMSIYNNSDQGEKLISKMKMHVKDKQRVLQKSIEQQANDACAALFAVYIKFYRRINLAKNELNRANDQKPHSKLLSIFEHANRIETLFGTRKGQGGDCDELYQQIKMKTFFLLSSIEESHLIPIIECVTNEQIDQRHELKLKRQSSRRKVEKRGFRLIRDLFQASIRFKKLMLAKKKTIEQKHDYESILNRSIHTYIHNDENHSHSNELIQCLFRQYERAMTRLITYRFIHKFIGKILNFEEKSFIFTFLSIYLPHLRNSNIEWIYLENISSTNIKIKEEIGNIYYSIIKQSLSYLLDSKAIEQPILIQNLFNLLNLSSKLEDIYYLHNSQFLETFFLTFIRKSYRIVSLDIKLIVYNWFRLYLLKFCQNFQVEQFRGTASSNLNQIREFIFYKLVLNQIKQLSIEKSPEYKTNSFTNASLGRSEDVSTKFEIELGINQWLMLLLRCVHSYEHVQSFCATIHFIEELLKIYRNSQNQITILLSLKILRKLILVLTETIEEKLRNIIENFLTEIFFSISSEGMTPDIVTELIYIYRVVISFKSSCQIMAIQKILSSLKSFQSIETNEIKNILSSLCILGGYVHPFSLGSVVQIFIDDETHLGVIMDIDINARDSNARDVRPYFVHYSERDKSEWVPADKLRIEVDVLPPNLLEFPNANDFLDSLFDALGYFIQIDTSTTKSLLLLQLKRRSIATLYRILINKNLVEIFLEKPYASIIAKLSTSALLSKTSQQPSDLRRFNKRHLEQYSLSLDRCEHAKQIIDDPTITDKDESFFIVWNDIPFKLDQLTNISESYDWKPNASKKEIQLFKQGRIGNDEIDIVPIPSQLLGRWLLEECGTMHRFPGRTYLISENSEASLGTFIIDNLRLTEGKWYYCVRLLGNSFIQIGWATTGFNPTNTIGIGNDKYSWSFDGSQGMIYNCEQYPFPPENTRWTANDVCGCGIEIDGDNIKINYWLNGHLLGTPFAHQAPINSTTTICDMLPNGPHATYFPGVSLKVNDAMILSSCEFIFSPEDMFECPLPKGYKPLLMPKLVLDDNLLVPYPYNAYLIGDDSQTIHNENSITLLRDFVNECHLETTFTCDNNQLILSRESTGFPLMIDCHEALTISFDVQVLTQCENVDILLLSFDPSETFSVRIPSSKISSEIRIAILFYPNDRQMKIYLNNEYQTIESPITTKSNIYILPTIDAGIKNLAIWKYNLSEEYIRRLFRFSLDYIARDYHRLNEYRKEINTLTFNSEQKHFTNELRVTLGENKSINEGIIQLFGNKTYLVLHKSINPWTEYTLILDISIAQLPTMNEQFILVTLNSQSTLYLTHDGQFCLSIDHRMNISSESKLKLNQFIRLLISVHEKSIKIYVNGLLTLNASVDDDQLTIKDTRIDLFREKDLTKSTTNEDTLRLECKSITYLNRATTEIDERMKSPNYSLETLVAPSYSIIAPSLIQIGYEESRIKSAMNENTTTNIQSIDTILRENIFSKLGPSIDKEKLKDFLQFFTFDTNEKKTDLAKIILMHWDDIQILSPILFDKKWFHQSVYHLNIGDSLIEWFRDKSKSIEQIDLTLHLININAPIQEQTMVITNIEKSIQYSHQQITDQQYSQSRICCEHGLISMYAHYTILNILRIWSNDESTLFPVEKFGDYTFIVTLLKMLNYHYVCTRLNTDENVDRMSSLIISILQNETNQLLKHHLTTQNKTTNELFQQKAPLLYQLQIDMIIQFLSNPSLICSDDTIVYKESNLNFILKVLNVFVKLINDKSTRKQDEIDFLIPLFFPIPLINFLFDLFLISSKHETKILILHLFSTLIQSSNKFNLNKHIQHFLFHLFVEFPPNPTSMNTRTMTKFQICIMDLVFLLFERQKSEMNTIEFEFLPSFHDLLMIIDVINVLTDKTKYTPFPEEFILQTIVLLDENHKFTIDDIEKCNSYFDRTADLQLIRFMNNHPLLELSFNEFINSLPTESLPNPTYYKTYPFLWHIPSICIQTRAILFYQFSKFMEKLVSIIDLSQLAGESILTDKIVSSRVYLLYQTKFQLFRPTLEMTALSFDGNMPTINFDTVKASMSDDDDHDLRTMFSQGYDQLHNDAHLLFRRTCTHLWRAQYVGMHSTDQGGPFRDSVSCMCSDICSTRLSLFILCPNRRTNSGLNRDRWIPNVFPPNKPIPNRIKKQYRFIGQLMGMAIRQKHYLDFKFPILLWKQLVREEITIEDIEAIDAQSFTMINQMEKTIKENNQLIDNDINDLLSSILDELKFEVVSSAGQTYELVPNGRNIPITASNFNKYCSSYRKYRLNEFHRQIEFIRQGLYSVVPGYFLSLFTPDELEEAVCGKGEIDVGLLKRNTNYGGHYDENSPSILRFWTVLSEMFNEDQKKLFLKFVWGRCTLPKCDDDFTKFRIDPYDVPNGTVDGALPRSHTCSFVLDLPDYSSTDIMCDRLNYAITYCSTIDGDGNMNQAPVSTDFQSDSTADEQ